MKKKKVFAVITYVFFLLFFLILYCFNNFSIEEDLTYFCINMFFYGSLGFIFIFIFKKEY